ncbi:hypothetical protein [Arthrobacter oryzae]|uniref:hypothetical protein n=1 Tax=Arthrobacter oryzae TaxID=409290 RepID=UPI002788AAA2|nr:hypothetical protein [Arthrobacter oryzae]MDQ0079497.1 hypothetical protein [Arthrobacter oryzae]
MTHPTTNRTGITHLPSAGHQGDYVECGCKGDGSCDPPHPLERNRFYPRKLMEVRHWQAEQRYHRGGRELLSRLGLGTGVLCGLELETTDSGTCLIRPGVGIDGRGRLVIVPQNLEVDPSQLTDCRGMPTDDVASQGTVTVALCYRECGTDLVPLPTAGCNDGPTCVPSMVREAYAVSVTLGTSPRVGLPEGLCKALITGHMPEEANPDTRRPPIPTEPDRRELLDLLHRRSCHCADLCIPLATVEFNGNDRTVQTTVRTVIRSNTELLDLILCLADRVNHCCSTHPADQPPRIAALWPWPDEHGEGLNQLKQTRELEVGFDRNMAEQGLEDPSDWFGVWMLDKGGARRLAVERSTSSLTHISAPVGGDAAVFATRFEAEAVSESTVFVVMARSRIGGPIRAAGTDQLALDADFAATGLTEEQREWLWTLPAGGNQDTSQGGFTDDVQAGPRSSLPTGNGLAGGELHIVYSRPVALPPRLLEVWPRGGQLLSEESPDRIEDWKSFIDRPRIEIVVSRALTGTAIASPSEWLRVWHAKADNLSLFKLEEIGLEKGEEQPRGDGTIRYIFRFRDGVKWFGRDEILTQLRSTGPERPESPLGREDPKVLLDADFRGTELTSQGLRRIWAGAPFPEGLRALPAKPTEGRTLYDGLPGELVDWGFTAIRPRQ